MTASTREAKCPAVLWHGPGHQSQASCYRSGPHEVHETVYGRLAQVARWRGAEATTGFFDDPPADFPELDRPPLTAPTREEVLEGLRRMPRGRIRRMTLLDPIPEGSPVSARNGHEPQHSTDPTWCKHCGEFAEWWGDLPCAHPGEHLYDSETVAGRKKIMEAIG